MAAFPARIEVDCHIIAAIERLHVIQYCHVPAIPFNLIGITVIPHSFDDLVHNFSPYSDWLKLVSMLHLCTRFSAGRQKKFNLPVYL